MPDTPKRRSTPAERHEMNRQDMANIRADPDTQHNLPLQLRGSAPQTMPLNPVLRSRGTAGPPEVIDDTPTPAGQGGIGSDYVADQGAPEDSGPAAAGYAKGGSVGGDTKPRYKGVIHKGAR